MHFLNGESHGNSSIENLSPDIRILLVDEMKAIERGMKRIIPAYAAGDSKTIASIGKNIKDSFLLKQNLTAVQKKEIQHRLPLSFIKLDELFHYNAGMLEHAANNNKQELIGFYFLQLLDSCSNCHRTFARHSFPHFNEGIKSNTHSH